MSFYDNTKEKRIAIVNDMFIDIKNDLQNDSPQNIIKFMSDEDTYIRKNCYEIMGQLYFLEPGLRNKIHDLLSSLIENANEKIRQTVVNTYGEIGKKEADIVLEKFEIVMKDEHHSIRNAVIGSLKKMGQVNPKPVLAFSKRFLHDPDVEIRRQVIHGIELRGRTHPEEIMPLLKECQFEKVTRIRNMVLHVIEQISYKKGCLEKVLNSLITWENKDLVRKAFNMIIDKHKKDEKFTFYSASEAETIVKKYSTRL